MYNRVGKALSANLKKKGKFFKICFFDKGLKGSRTQFWDIS